MDRAGIRQKLEIQNHDRARKYTSNIMIVIGLVAYMLLRNVGFNMLIFDNNKKICHT